MTHRNTIMIDRDGTNANVLAAQAEMFRLAERDYKLNLKTIALETGIPIGTLQSFNRGNIFARARIGLPDFVLLCRVIPDDLTSLCLEPSGKHVGTDEAGDGDLDALARESAGYNVEYLDARDPNSEAGAAIGPREAARLKERARRMAATARRAA